MSRITDLVQITAANTTASFAVGMAFTLVSILAGLSAGEAERGKVFGTLSLTLGAGMLIGGIVAGPIADRWGFPILLLVSAGGMGLALLCGFFFRDVTVVSRIPDGPRNATSRRAPLGGSYILLWGSVLLMSLAWYGGALGRIVAMNQLGFAATAISIATAVGGVVSLPVPLVLGWLSDRIGRKRLILFCYLAALAGLLIVAWTQLLWSFWGASALLTVGFTAYPLACALVADIVPPESLGMGLSLISAGSTLGGLLGSIGMGLAIQHMGAQTAFLAAALMPLAAAILLVPIHERAVRQETALPVAP
jgi:MFS family permease